MVSNLKEGGIFLLNSPYNTLPELEQALPASIKNIIAKKKVRVYNIDAIQIAQSIGMGGRINTVMQSAFFKIAGVIPEADAIDYMKQAALKSYGRKGEKIVNMNYAAIDAGAEGLTEIKYPDSWATTTEGASVAPATGDEYFDTVVHPILIQEGDKLPVSAFTPDGVVPTGTTQYEKRGVAVNLPNWILPNCIQCNQCSIVCPHACIRPVLVKEEDLKDAPAGFETKPAMGLSLIHI